METHVSYPSDKPQRLPSEELPAFTRSSLNFNQMSEDLLEMPGDDDNCEIEIRQVILDRPTERWHIIGQMSSNQFSLLYKNICPNV